MYPVYFGRKTGYFPDEFVSCAILLQLCKLKFPGAKTVAPKSGIAHN